MLLLLSGSHFACTREEGSDEVVCAESPAGASAPYKVKRLASSQTVIVGDSSLAEWDGSFVVMEIASLDASARQWRDVRGRAPAPLERDDFGIRVYMARDNSFWYVAVDAADDKVIASQSPYSGDCLEILFAGEHLDSPADTHRHVAPSGNQAAFFQLTIPAAPLRHESDYFPDYRTDAAFRNSNSLRSQFAVSIWATRHGWSAEARIPLDALDDDVNSRLNGRQPLKMNLDYLDYDARPAQRSAQDGWGFYPDNVFCLDREERSVNIPRCMRPVTFD